MVLGLLNQLQIPLQLYLTVEFARTFYRSGATQTVAFDICGAFNRVWHTGLLQKLKPCGISGQIFRLISSFLSNRLLQVVLDGKFSQEYLVNVGVPQGSILGPTLFLLYINDLHDVICDTSIYANDNTLYSKCDQTGERSCLLILILGNLNWFHLTGLITVVLLM